MERERGRERTKERFKLTNQPYLRIKTRKVSTDTLTNCFNQLMIHFQFTFCVFSSFMATNTLITHECVSVDFVYVETLWVTNRARLTITFYRLVPARILVGQTHLSTIQFDEWFTCTIIDPYKWFYFVGMWSHTLFRSQRIISVDFFCKIMSIEIFFDIEEYEMIKKIVFIREQMRSLPINRS